MAGKNTAVFALFQSRAAIDSTVDDLKNAGFRNSDISVLFPDKDGTREFAHEKATKAPEGAATGGTSGAVIGGTLGWLVGIGSLAIPGVGPFIAAGPIMAALAGAGIGGAVGGLTGALVGMGIPEYEAKRYEGLVKDGGILMSVHSDDSQWTDKAKKIFEAHGGKGIDSTGEATGNVIKGTEAKDHPVSRPRDSNITNADFPTGL